MNRVLIFSICAVVAALGGACSNHGNDQAGKTNIVDLAIHPAPAGAVSAITVMGCLTASGDRFVLTQFDKQSSQNHAYQLVNANNELRNLVGQRVQIIGNSRPAQSVEAREITPSAVATSGTANAKGRVNTVEDTRIDENTLQVTSVMPAGGKC